MKTVERQRTREGRKITGLGAQTSRQPAEVRMDVGDSLCPPPRFCHSEWNLTYPHITNLLFDKEYFSRLARCSWLGLSGLDAQILKLSFELLHKPGDHDRPNSQPLQLFRRNLRRRTTKFHMLHRYVKTPCAQLAPEKWFVQKWIFLTSPWRGAACKRNSSRLYSQNALATKNLLSSLQQPKHSPQSFTNHTKCRPHLSPVPQAFSAGKS